MSIEPGQKVKVIDQPYIGKVQQVKKDKAYIRWHKGYASWVDIDRLIIVE